MYCVVACVCVCVCVCVSHHDGQANEGNVSSAMKRPRKREKNGKKITNTKGT